MTLISLIIFTCTLLSVHAAKKIHIYGERHGQRAEEYRKQSWEKYKKGEIDFLCEGSPPGITTVEQLWNVKPCMLEDENDWGLLMNDYIVSRLLFYVAISANQEMYNKSKEDLRQQQTMLDDPNLIKLPLHWSDGNKIAWKLFHEKWNNFTNTAANQFWFLEGWKNYKLDQVKIHEELQLFYMILNKFRELSWARKIVKKFKECEKDLYVHLGEYHRESIENILKTVHQIPRTQINGVFLKDTRF